MKETHNPRVRIRAARKEDFYRIKELNRETFWQEISDHAKSQIDNFDELYEKLWTAFSQKQGNAFYVAEDFNGEIVGELWVGINKSDLFGEDIAWIYDITVKTGYQGRGIGTVLMEKTVEHAHMKGLKEIGLMVNARNTKAVELYEKMGFQTRNLIMFKNVR
jgi:ribosomal protein S18 acetylase RimI-like enzyme